MRELQASQNALIHEYLQVLTPGERKGRNTLIRREYCDSSIQLPFETITASAPKEGYDQILKGIYGDYMQLPFPSKRVSRIMILSCLLKKSWQRESPLVLPHLHMKNLRVSSALRAKF